MFSLAFSFFSKCRRISFSCISLCNWLCFCPPKRAAHFFGILFHQHTHKQSIQSPYQHPTTNTQRHRVDAVCVCRTVWLFCMMRSIDLRLLHHVNLYILYSINIPHMNGVYGTRARTHSPISLAWPIEILSLSSLGI